MKHKLDAMENAARIIESHRMNDGMTYYQSMKASIVTVEVVLGALATRNMTHSLYMRTLNYLNYLVLSGKLGDGKKPLVYPNWFTPLVQGVVKELWNDNKPGENLRMGAVKYMQEEAMKSNEQIFIADAIDLIKTVL
jgi:hypothetical protein